jgi:hypothetical protein
VKRANYEQGMTKTQIPFLEDCGVGISAFVRVGRNILKIFRKIKKGNYRAGMGLGISKFRNADEAPDVGV